MSGIARLSHDLLSHVLCLASGSDLARKLAVAQVSARWRQIALASPLLWSRICLSAKRDCRLLPLVLARCGPSVLIDVEVSGAEPPGAEFSITEPAPLELEAAMRTLEPYAARIRSIKTNIWFEALLSSNLEFPELHTLRVHSARPKVITRFVRLRAHNLRVLDLNSVSLRELQPLISEQLIQLHVDSCPGVWPRDLTEVLTRCVNLVRLTFSADEAVWKSGPPLDIQQQGMHRLLYLRTAEFCMPISLLVAVLDDVINKDALSSLTLYFPTQPTSEELSGLWAALPFRSGHITRLEMEDFESVKIGDDAGREVSTSMYYEVRPAPARLWPCISNGFRAHETVRELTIPLAAWEDFASEDWATHPPRAVRTLRLVVYFTEDDPVGVVLKVRFCRLRRVEFCATRIMIPAGTPFLAALVVGVLQRIVWDSEVPLEVAVRAEVDAAEIEETRDLMERDGGGRWQLLNEPGSTTVENQ